MGDLVDAFARLGHLTHASLANHARANARAVIGGSSVYDGGRLPEVGEDRGYVSVLPWVPPSARGASTPGLPAKVGWILDHLEGFVWPGADVDRLREAASAWRVAAGSLADVAGCCDSAVRGFWLERSPEIPMAVEATAALRSQVLGLADSFAGLAVACDSYADAVAVKHAQIIELAEWLLEQVVEGIVISVALGVLTGGAGTGVGLGAVAVKVVAESPRFTALLDALRALAAGCAASARAARETIGLARLRLVKFKDAAVARSVAQGERGEMRLLWTRERGWLRTHERPPSHTLGAHVARSSEALIERLHSRPRLEFVSTFPDEQTAERALSLLYTRHQDKIEDWLTRAGERPLRLDDDFGFVTGRTADRDGVITQVTGVRAILVKDASMPDGFRTLTAFPQP